MKVTSSKFSIIESIKSEHTLDSLTDLTNSFSKLKILVVGDTIIDEYHNLEPIGLASKSTAISTRFISSERHAGGSLAVANHISSFCKHVSLLTDSGESKSYNEFVSRKLNNNVSITTYSEKGRVFTVKKRYVGNFQKNKLFEVSDINDSYLGSKIIKSICNDIIEKSKKVDLVVVADFGHFFINDKVKKTLENLDNYLCLNVQTNSSNYGFNLFTKYKKANFLSIDEKEVRLAFSDRESSVLEIASNFSKNNNFDKIAVTLGKEGSLLFFKNSIFSSPAFVTKTLDTIGSGDAFFSLASLTSFISDDPKLISFFGNCAGGLCANYLGNSSFIRKDEFINFIREIYTKA